MYLRNADGISIRVKVVLGRAFERLESVGRKQLPPPVSADEIRERSTAYVAGLTPTSKAERMRTVLELYLTGKSIDAIVTETGSGQGTVSAYLNEIQNGAAVQLGCSSRFGSDRSLSRPSAFLSGGCPGHSSC